MAIYQYLWLIPALPYAGFLILALLGGRLPRWLVAVIGCGSVGAAAALVLTIGYNFLKTPPPNHAFDQTLWTWMSVAGFSPSITLHLDAVSLLMMFVITFVGFLIHLYSVEYMWPEEGFSRFFAYMNLFVGMMLILVLGGNLLLLYLGWEGVGLCSYLLIGFWYKDPANGRAARKAFITTRVGDTAFAIGLFLLFKSLGTLDIQELMHRASTQWQTGAGVALAAALLLLGGAVGKSAQLPLQVWLPDAMAGPTPVSALIHAATMVTAGVYLIVRMHVIFDLAPAARLVVGIIGALTLLIAGFTALTQTDIKRVLAYSTISQIGYMFLALGAGAWTAAMFHFMTHAFFKALLFLGAGAVILAQHHEQNMFKMGGLRREIPVTYVCFLIGSASLAALPLVTAGFYSKDMILYDVWSMGGMAGLLLWLAGFVSAFITAIYTFRMVFLTFFGESKTHVTHRPGAAVLIPLAVLAFFSIAAGFIELPRTLGDKPLFSHFLSATLPVAHEGHGGLASEIILQIVTALVSLGGVYVAYLFYIRHPERTAAFASGSMEKARRFLFSGWGFDALYNTLFIHPYVWLARVNRRDFIDRFWDFVAWFNEGFHLALSFSQTGKVRWYVMVLAFGAALTLAIMVFL